MEASDSLRVNDMAAERAKKRAALNVMRPERISEPAAEWVHLDNLRPWVKNPRRNDHAAREVAQSIRRFGFGAPLVARRENLELIAGHTRVKAVLLLAREWAEASAEERESWHPEAVQVATEKMLPVRLRDLSEHEAHLLAIADNKLGELADWDEPGLADSEGYNFRGAVRDLGQRVRQCLIWVKNSLVLGRQDYQWQHEPCLYGWTEGAPHRWFSDRKQTTTLHFDKPQRNAHHPTMKPPPLFAYLMGNSTKRGERTLDPFLGSGTSVVAAEQMDRACSGTELDPRYCDVIVERWQNLTGEKASRARL